MENELNSRKCGDCSRRKFYQIGYKDGYKDACNLIYRIAKVFVPEYVASLDCDDVRACEFLADEIIKFAEKREK